MMSMAACPARSAPSDDAPSRASPVPVSLSWSASQLFERRLLLEQKAGQAAQPLVKGIRLDQLAVDGGGALPKERSPLNRPAREVAQAADEVLQLERVGNCGSASGARSS